VTVLGFGIVRGTEIVFRDEAEHGRLGVSLLRTLRLPDDGVRYPLPPGMGPLPLRRVQDLKGRVPPEWLARPGVVVPMYRCEAIWLLFSADHPLPHAVKVGCGGINALTGRPLSRRLERPEQPGLWRRMLGAAPAQDYAVCPPQQFIDGFNTGHHSVRQFVAVPLGEGRTVEAQVTGDERHGGIQLCVYPPRPEREAALASAGRLALPGLLPVTAGGSVPETETAPWEWNGPGDAATPPMPPVPPEFPPDGVHATTVDLAGPAGSPDGAYAATVDLVTPAGSPDSADTTMVDLATQAAAVDTPRDDSPITLRGYPASPGHAAPVARPASPERRGGDDLPRGGPAPQRADPSALRGGYPQQGGYPAGDDRLPDDVPRQGSPPLTRSAGQTRGVQPTPFAGPIVRGEPRGGYVPQGAPAPVPAAPPPPAPAGIPLGAPLAAAPVHTSMASPSTAVRPRPDRVAPSSARPPVPPASGHAPGPAASMLGSAAAAPQAKRSVSAAARVQPAMDRPLGLGAGGQISQRIYADAYGIETWDEAACAELFIHIVSPRTWYAMTGEPPPPTPVTFRAYQAAGLPWFQIYDEELPGIAASPELARIRPVDDFDRRR
jgi:hypothetical protein